MTDKDRKEYMKAYYQSHKEEHKAYNQSHKEERKAYNKAYYQSHKEEMKAKTKSYYQSHKEEQKAYIKAWRQEHKEEQKAYYQSHKEEYKEYQKSDTNSLGQTKKSVRTNSRRYLFNTLIHTKVEGYEIHHCFGYDDFKHFIYIPKELHLQIHQFLRDNGIDADSDHYSKIEHLIVNYLKCHDRHVLIMHNKDS